MLSYLKNDILKIGIESLGAELTSIQSLVTGKEYMWSGDKAIWGRRAPILFPIVGRLKDDQYTVGREKYKLGQHGFARTSEFAVISQNYEAIMYRLSYSRKTLPQFPFPFMLEVLFALQGNELAVGYRVYHEGEAAMHFSIGAHPGFACPPEEGPWYLEFDKAETAPRHFLENGLLTGKTQDVFKGSNHIEITAEIFNQDALIFKGLNSSKVTLKSNNTSRSVTLTLNDFPYLGIWAKPGAPYVCIEPWFGLADSVDATGILSDKEGIIALEAGKGFQRQHSILID